MRGNLTPFALVINKEEEVNTPGVLGKEHAKPPLLLGFEVTHLVPHEMGGIEFGGILERFTFDLYRVKVAL